MSDLGAILQERAMPTARPEEVPRGRVDRTCWLGRRQDGRRPAQSRNRSSMESRNDPAMRIILAHDYLTQRGGAERVALELARQFPKAPLLTSFYSPGGTYSGFDDIDVRPSALSRVAILRNDPRLAFPVLALLFSARRAPPGVVLASSSGWAHGLRTRGPKVVYCHNPARWLYQPADYFAGLPRQFRSLLGLALAPMRIWDRRAARSAAAYLANSTAVAARIADAYGIEARVVHPPSGLHPGDPQDPLPGIDPGFFLTIGRRRGYKNSRVVCEAAEACGARLIVVGGLPERDEPWPDHVVGVCDLKDASLRWLYENCRAVIAVSHEDFGLTPVEGFAFGKPSIVLRGGGYLDSCVEGVTGTFVDAADSVELASVIMAFDEHAFSAEAIRRHALNFTPDSFGKQVLEVLEAAAGAVLTDQWLPQDTRDH